jgi:hypothetical protein
MKIWFTKKKKKKKTIIKRLAKGSVRSGVTIHLIDLKN